MKGNAFIHFINVESIYLVFLTQLMLLGLDWAKKATVKWIPCCPATVQ